MACVRKRRDRWVVDYYDHLGTRRWLTLRKGATRNDANQKLGEIEKKVARGIEVAPKKPARFSEVADKWLASKEPNIRYSTHEQYRGHVEKHLKPYFGNLKIS